MANLFRFLVFAALAVIWHCLSPADFGEHALAAQKQKRRKAAPARGGADQQLSKHQRDAVEAISRRNWSAAITSLNAYAKRAMSNKVNRPDLALRGHLKKLEVAAQSSGPRTSRSAWLRTAINDSLSLVDNELRRFPSAKQLVLKTVESARSAIQADTATRPFDQVLEELALLEDARSTLNGVADKAQSQRNCERSEAVYRRNLIHALIQDGRRTDSLRLQIAALVEPHVLRLAEILEDQDPGERMKQLDTIDAYITALASLEVERQFAAAVERAVEVVERVYGQNSDKRKALYSTFANTLSDRLTAATGSQARSGDVFVTVFVEMARRGFGDDPKEHALRLRKVYDLGEELPAWDTVATATINALEISAGRSSAEVIRCMLDLADYRAKKLRLVHPASNESPEQARERYRHVADRAAEVARYYDEIASRLEDQQVASENLLTCLERATDYYVLSGHAKPAAERVAKAVRTAEMLGVEASRLRELSYRAGFIHFENRQYDEAIVAFEKAAGGESFAADLIAVESLTMMARANFAKQQYAEAYRSMSSALKVYQQTDEFRQKPLSEKNISSQAERYWSLASIAEAAAANSVTIPNSAVGVLIECRNFIAQEIQHYVGLAGSQLSASAVATGAHTLLFEEREMLAQRLLTLTARSGNSVPSDLRNSLLAEKRYFDQMREQWAAEAREQQAASAAQDALRAVEVYKYRLKNGSGLGQLVPAF